MDKKKILIIVGVVAVVGIGYYLWNKSKKTAEIGAEGNIQAPADSTTKTADAPADAPTKKPIKGRKEKKKACGRKPLNKKKKEDWQKCVDAGGTDSFEGSDFDQFRNDYVDFSGLNLDL